MSISHRAAEAGHFLGFLDPAVANGSPEESEGGVAVDRGTGPLPGTLEGGNV